jgi:2-phosphoglycerate kinase
LDARVRLPERRRSAARPPAVQRLAEAADLPPSEPADITTDHAPPLVVLLAGAPGAGKSQLSYRLAGHLGAALVEVDDLVVAVQALTQARTHRDLHFWLQHDDASMTTEQVVDGQIRLARALEPALTAVIENHLETATRVVIEGDYVVPGEPAHPAVRTALIVEHDVDQLIANYQAREPELGDQRGRAATSLAYGAWLSDRACAAGVPIVAARPWASVFERLLSALALDRE